MTIDEAIAEIEQSGLYGNQVHQETLVLARDALRTQQQRENPQPPLRRPEECATDQLWTERMIKMRLIDADALGKRLDNEKWMDNYDRDFIVDVALDESPTVDAVQVCRCRDCTHFRAQRIYNGEPMLYVCCRTNGYSCGENHFCAWGEQSTVPMRYRYAAGCISYYDGEKERSSCD